jgi:glycosyltransferase involved in cell wall biosynthesis
VYTHEESNAPWKFEAGADASRVVVLGRGERAMDQSALGGQMHEWRKGGEIVRFLRERQIGAVVVEGYNDAGRLRVIRWCARRRIPVFLFGDSNIRGDRASGMKAWIKRLLLKRVIRQCSGILVCGRLGRQYFEKYGADPSRIYYFPYEPDYDLISGLSADEIESARVRFGLRPGRRRIIYSGRLVPQKRVELLVSAFVRLAEERPDWDLLIVGDGVLRETLAAMIPPPLAGRVTWTGFVGDQRLVSALYRLSDVLVLPSEYEPWAVVINEAAAAGLAIVASDVVGAAFELVSDGVNGRTFRATDAAGLEEALRDVTHLGRIEPMKKASPRVLTDWRAKADPLSGLRQALSAAGASELDAGWPQQPTDGGESGMTMRLEK